MRLPRGFLDIEGRALRLAIEHQMRHDLDHYKAEDQIITLNEAETLPHLLAPLRAGGGFRLTR